MKSEETNQRVARIQRKIELDKARAIHCNHCAYHKDSNAAKPVRNWKRHRNNQFKLRR